MGFDIFVKVFKAAGKGSSTRLENVAIYTLVVDSHSTISSIIQKLLDQGIINRNNCL